MSSFRQVELSGHMASTALASTTRAFEGCCVVYDRTRRGWPGGGKVLGWAGGTKAGGRKTAKNGGSVNHAVEYTKDRTRDDHLLDGAIRAR